MKNKPTTVLSDRSYLKKRRGSVQHPDKPETIELARLVLLESLQEHIY